MYKNRLKYDLNASIWSCILLFSRLLQIEITPIPGAGRSAHPIAAVPEQLGVICERDSPDSIFVAGALDGCGQASRRNPL